jgi:hypothetical protein
LHFYKNFKLDVQVAHKSNNLDRNWREFINIKKLELCDLLENLESSPLKLAIQQVNATFPGLVKRCPLSAINVVNGTSSNLADDNNYALTLFPNGIFRVIFTFYDDIDEKIFQMTYYFELYNRRANFMNNLFENAGSG